jgi:uncharacterized protein YecT (DUF1311 family)
MIFALLWIFVCDRACAASFDCEKARTDVEKKICADPELSHLDDQLEQAYQMASHTAPNTVILRDDQRNWLAARNRCSDKECLRNAYSRRLKALSYFQPESFEPKAWVARRELTIKTVLGGKRLYIFTGGPSDSPFCHQFMEDVKSLHGMEIIAPEVIANSLRAPDVQGRIFDHCPGLYNRWGLEQPRKVTLYHVDIDNEPANGREWLLGDHYVLPISPRWGDELLVRNDYKILDVESCKNLGMAYVGASQRNTPETDPYGLALDTGIHGVLRYRGKYYIYDVIDEPKVDPVTLHEYRKRGDSTTASICIIKEKLGQEQQGQGE